MFNPYFYTTDTAELWYKPRLNQFEPVKASMFNPYFSTTDTAELWFKPRLNRFEPVKASMFNPYFSKNYAAELWFKPRLNRFEPVKASMFNPYFSKNRRCRALVQTPTPRHQLRFSQRLGYLCWDQPQPRIVPIQVVIKP